jgi:hypothetical protein
MEEIAGALISATGSVLVALIGEGRSARARSGARPRATYDIPARNRRIWTFVVALLFLWSAYSPLAVEWSLAAINLLFVVPAVTVVLSALWPIKPFWAASVALMLYAGAGAIARSRERAPTGRGRRPPARPGPRSPRRSRSSRSFEAAACSWRTSSERPRGV